MGVVTWHPDMPLEYRDQIVTGDARELAGAIPDASVDLCFCDPVYDRLDDYRWLAETCARVLRAGGNLLAWVSNHEQFEVWPVLSEHLDFAVPLSYVIPGKTARRYQFKVFKWSATCLWFYRPPFDLARGWTIDTVISTRPPAGSHEWNKNPEAVARWLSDLTQPGDLVWDPFAGGGTLPSVAKSLGRHFIASEVNPKIAAGARDRILATMPPLFALPASPPLTLALEEAI